MYNKHNLAIAKVASKSTIKPALACVAFYGNRTVATDSFRLIEMSANGDAHDAILHDAKIVNLKKLPKGTSITREVIGAVEVDDTYPAIDQVLDRQFSNTDKEYVSVTVNGKYLAEVCKILADLSPLSRITLEIEKSGDVQNAIRISSHNGKTNADAQKARALVMSMTR